jgi:predicted nucleic acid-binding protein
MPPNLESIMSGQTNQRIDPKRLWDSLMDMARFGATPKGGVRRLTLTDIEREFDSLVRRHTATHGFRTYDIIHVASALKLKCRRFLSFDAKANSLARLAGLKTL